MLPPYMTPACAGIAALGENFEAQRARDRRSLHQPHRDAIAEAISLAAACADERVSVLVIAEIVRADRARGHEAVGPGVAELDKKPGAGRPGDVPGKSRTDAIGEEMRDQAVEGLAFGFHGAALGGGDLRANLAKRSRVLLLRQAAVTEPRRANEAAVDDEVGIAADGRGEMRVAAQVQAEMPV